MKNFRISKTLIILLASVFVLFAVSAIAINGWIRSDVEKNIIIAQQLYPGTAEEALISFLLDEKNSFNDRSNKRSAGGRERATTRTAVFDSVRPGKQRGNLF